MKLNIFKMSKFILSLFLILFVLLYPFWNIILLITYSKFGVVFSTSLLKIKYFISILTLIILIIKIIYTMFKSKSTTIANCLFLLLLFYIINNIVVNYLFYPHMLSLKDFVVILYTNLLLIFIFLLPFIKLNAFNGNINIFYWLFKIYLGIGLFIIIFGFFEKLFISDEFLKSLHYNQLLGLAKGLKLKTYSHAVPDNLFTMMKELRIRRMISLIGEPLYFAYYIFPITFIFFSFFYLKRSIFSFFLFFFSLVALILSISRNMIIAFIIGFWLFMVFQEKKYKNIFILLFSLIVVILIPIIPFLMDYFYKKDISFQGHINSFIYFVKYIGLKGLLIPTFETTINNLILLKKEVSNFIAESTFLIILSNFGIFITSIILVYSISMIFITIKKVNNKLTLDIKGNYIVVAFMIAFPYIIFGYLTTIIFSPHIITFQIGNYIIGLWIFYLIFKKYY